MKKPIMIAKNASLLEVIKKLVDCDISRIIMVNEDKVPAGIISEKDVGLYLFSDKTTRSLEQIPLDKNLIKEIEFVDISDTLKHCASIMFEKDIGSLVVGNKNNLKGIITKTDIVKYFAEHYFGKHKVVDLKNPGFISVSAESSISDTINKMIKNNISRIIVTNRKDKPLGIITFRDFFAISLELGSETDVIEPSALLGHVRKGFLSEQGFGGISLARDIMNKKIISVSPDNDLASACQIMVDNHLNGLAVADEKEMGTIGIISKTDIIQFFSLL
jgi:CBS domain-containing protein